MSDIYNIQYNDATSLYISTGMTKNGTEKISIEAFEKEFIFTNNQLININNVLLDNTTIQPDTNYLTWLLLDSYGVNSKGFGLGRQPSATVASLTGGSKGSSCVLTLNSGYENCGYQFVVGATVFINKADSYYNTENANKGRVTNVSKTTITVQLDNESYGGTLSGNGHKVIQLNKFKLIDINTSYNNDVQKEFPFYKQLDYIVQTNEESEIKKFIKLEQYLTQFNYPNDNTTTEKKAIIRFDRNWKMTTQGNNFFEVYPNTIENVITNGSMLIWQRGGASTNIAAGTNTYQPDRFAGYQNAMGYATVPTIAQSNSVPSNEIFLWSTQITNNQAIASVPINGEVRVRHIVEGYSQSQIVGRFAVFSFFVRSSKTGTYCICFRNTGADRSFVQEYTINTVSTWEFKWFLIPMDYSGGTWNYSNAIGLRVEWILARNAAAKITSTTGQWLTGDYEYTANQVNWADSATATFFITGVQLHEGDYPLRYRPLKFHEDLERCQRYYEKSIDYGTVPQDLNTSTSQYIGTAWSTTNINTMIKYQVRKRTTPTITPYSDTGGTSVWAYYLGSTVQFTSQALDGNTERGFNYNMNKSTAPFTAGDSHIIYGHWTSDAEF